MCAALGRCALKSRTPPHRNSPQVAQDRRAGWRKFGEAATERATDSVTSQTPDEVQLERIQRQKQTQVGGRWAGRPACAPWLGAGCNHAVCALGPRRGVQLRSVCPNPRCTSSSEPASRAPAPPPPPLQEEKSKAADFQTAMAGSDKSAIVGSLRDMLYKKRMERQLLAAKGLIAAPERPPDEVRPAGRGGSEAEKGSGRAGVPHRSKCGHATWRLPPRRAGGAFWRHRLS